MPASLSAEQTESYRNNGYLFPLPLFNRLHVQMILEEYAEARRQAEDKGLGDDWARLTRANAQLLLPFVYQVGTAPALLDAVESVLGPDLLLWSAEFFIKPPRSDKIVSWHQDLTYWGLGETDEEITAWVALSDVRVESGCMRFLPGSHRQRILPHRDTFDESNLLSRGQQVDVDVNEDEAVDVLLEPGQVSLHHGRIFHASGPNQSDHDRIGLVFRFLTPKVRQLVAQRDYAMLVRGIDEHNNWIHVAPPTRNFDDADLALYERIREDQRQALAAGAQETLHAAY